MKVDLMNVFVFFVFLFSVNSTEWTCGENCKASLESGVLTIKGSGNMEDYKSSSDVPWSGSKSLILSAVVEEGVTSIGSHAFSNCSSLASVNLPDSITKIGTRAFSYCSKLTSIAIPNSVKKIKEWAFYWCFSLTSGSIWSVKWELNKKTGEMVFKGDGDMIDFFESSSRPWDASMNSIKKVTIANGVTMIGGGAFSSCSSLTAVSLSSTLRFIGNYAFSSCSQLEPLRIPSSVKLIGVNAFDNCPKWTEGTLGDISWTLSNGELNLSGSGNMPEFYPGGAPWHSSSSDITMINVGEGITSIGDYAFYDCKKLDSVTLPTTVKSIGFNVDAKGATIPADIIRTGGCGMDCIATLSDGVLSIEGSGKMTDFANRISLHYSEITAPWYSIKSSIKEVKISEGITTIGRYAFYQCSKMTSVSMPNSIKVIEDTAFAGSSALASITFPNGLTAIGNHAFADCSSLTAVTLPDTLETLGDYAFSLCTLGSVTITNRVKIGWCVFSNTIIGLLAITGTGELKTIPSCISQGLASVAISEGITTIRENAFSQCATLHKVKLPKTVVDIGNNAFKGCTNLEYISVDAGNPKYQSINNVLFARGENFDLVKYPPRKRSTAYEIPANVTEISDDAFADCANLETVMFCGSLNDYKDAKVVTGTSSFVARVTSAFNNETFYGQQLTKDLTTECLADKTPSSSKSTAGVVAGCVCGAVAIATLIVVVIRLKRSHNANKQSIELEDKASLLPSA